MHKKLSTKENSSINSFIDEALFFNLKHNIFIRHNKEEDFEKDILDKSSDCSTDDILVDLIQQETMEYFDFVNKMKLAPARYTAYISENDTIGILQYEGLAAPLDYYLQSNNIEFPEFKIHFI